MVLPSCRSVQGYSCLKYIEFLLFLIRSVQTITKFFSCVVSPSTDSSLALQQNTNMLAWYCLRLPAPPSLVFPSATNFQRQEIADGRVYTTHRTAVASQDMETHGHKLCATSVWERCFWSQVVSLHLWIKVFDHPPGCFAWNDWSFCVKKFSAITLKALLKLRTVNAFYWRMGYGLCMVRMGIWK